MTYHVGPGPAQARVKLAFDWQSRPLHNVIVRIEGSTFPDEWVIFGNHHDAWVNGADDPISGAVALMETGRGLAELLKTGLAAEAHDHPRAVGRRGMGAARLDGVGREARRRAQGQGRGLHQLRQHRQRLAQRRRLARPAAADERSGARRHGSAHGEAGARGSRAGGRCRARPRPSAQRARKTPTSGCRRSAPARTTRRFSST